MNRLTLVLFISAVIPPSVEAVGIVPPIVRVQSVDLPAVHSVGDDDPLKTIERITRNARAVGDRLREEDSGADTQEVQDRLLKDIDSLLQTPPPKGGGGGNPPPTPPMSDESQTGDKPMQSGGDGSSRNRPRGEQRRMPSGSTQKPMQSSEGDMAETPPSGREQNSQTQNTANVGGTNTGGTGIPGGGDPPINLPLDDPFTRRVWGHLPEKVRQQALQSYREQFMPRYSEMLKHYYSTLGEKQTSNPPR